MNAGFSDRFSVTGATLREWRTSTCWAGQDWLFANLDPRSRGLIWRSLSLSPPCTVCHIFNLLSLNCFHCSDMECSICKEPFNENDQARPLPCTHLFHNDCITPWLKLVSQHGLLCSIQSVPTCPWFSFSVSSLQRDTCPTCRYSLNKGEILPDPQIDSTDRTMSTS